MGDRAPASVGADLALGLLVGEPVEEVLDIGSAQRRRVLAAVGAHPLALRQPGQAADVVTHDAAAVALEQARRILTDGIAALAQITIRREPDCFGIEAPRGTGDGRARRLVHTTVPLTIAVAAAGQRSAWPAAKRRLGTQLRRLPAIRAEIGAVGEVVIRDVRHKEVDRIWLR